MNSLQLYLTQKQWLFVENYIQNGGNGTAAARAAGYKGSTATLGAVAHENLNKYYIRDEIQRRQGEIRERMQITTQAKRERLWAIANLCAEVDEAGRSRTLETTPEGGTTETIRVRHRVRDPKTALEAIKELNRMDGDYAALRPRSIAEWEIPAEFLRENAVCPEAEGPASVG